MSSGLRIDILEGHANLSLTTTGAHTAYESNDPIDTFEVQSHLLANYIGPLIIGFEIATTMDYSG